MGTFGKKASSVFQFGKKAGQKAIFGIKKGARYAAKYGQPISDLATVGATLAMSLGQPEIAAPLIGIAKGASKASHYGGKVDSGIREIEKDIKGLQKMGKKSRASQSSNFEQPQASQASPQAENRMVVFESSPAPAPKRMPFKWG
tara:strand:- start:2849 stop:3283 length:435 start_codon:yes stop_codon:yes gene_type:complete